MPKQSERQAVNAGLANRLKKWAAALTLFAALAYSPACGSDPADGNVNKSLANAANTQTPQVSFNFPDKDYSKFDHQSEQHQRLPCLVCHTENAAAQKVKFPGHTPCASCHVQHFEQKDHSICSVCHTDSRTEELKAFPTLAAFNTRFDHARHLPHANCTTCHTTRGAAVSIPVRSAAHATCFQCHGPETTIGKAEIAKGNNIDSCSTCHQQGSPRPLRASRGSSGTFSHARHSGLRAVNCTTCHTVRAGGVRDQVSEPSVAMHFSSGRGMSCATCHNGKRAFGDSEFSNCKRCHQGGSFKL